MYNNNNNAHTHTPMLSKERQSEQQSVASLALMSGEGLNKAVSFFHNNRNDPNRKVTNDLYNNNNYTET